MVEPAERHQCATLGLAGVVSERLDELEILARPGAGNFEEHASNFTATHLLQNMDLKVHNVPLHDFFKPPPENPHGYVAKRSKNDFFGGELSNLGALCFPLGHQRRVRLPGMVERLLRREAQDLHDPALRPCLRPSVVCLYFIAALSQANDVFIKLATCRPW